jgi:acyl carrier protein
VSVNAKFADLDLDSLDIVEVVLAIEEEFAIEIPDVSHHITLSPFYN